MVQNPLSNFNYNAVPIAQKSIAAAGISNTYALVGSVFSFAPIIVIIVSTLDESVQFSWDGVTDAFPIPAGATLIIDFKSDGSALPAIVYGPYVKEIGNPTTGSLYVGGFTI